MHSKLLSGSDALFLWRMAWLLSHSELLFCDFFHLLIDVITRMLMFWIFMMVRWYIQIQYRYFNKSFFIVYIAKWLVNHLFVTQHVHLICTYSSCSLVYQFIHLFLYYIHYRCLSSVFNLSFFCCFIIYFKLFSVFMLTL